MRRAMISAAVALVTAVAVTLPAQAATQERDVERTYRANVWMEQRAHHVVTDVYVDVAMGKAREGSLPYPLPFIYVYIDRWNVRTERPLFNGSRFAALPEGALAIDHRLAWATLNVSIMVRDSVHRERVPVSLDIRWTRWGDPIRERWTDVVRSPDGKIVMHGMARMLAAGDARTAVTIGRWTVEGQGDGRRMDSSVYRFAQRSVTVVHA